MFLSILAVYVSCNICTLLEKKDISQIHYHFKQCFYDLYISEIQRQVFFYLEGIIVAFLLYFLSGSLVDVRKCETMKITDQIMIPKAIGDGQHGTSRFLTEKEKESIFHIVIKKKEKELQNSKNCGLVIGMEKISKTIEKIYCVEDDVHTLILGATRSGKTRCMIEQSIWLRASTGKSMLISDPKGELFLDTAQYLKEHGYDVIDFDLRQPLKGIHYNYLEMINQFVDNNDISRAIDATWDITSVLVGMPKGEPLWTNGEAAVIAASIMAVVLEAPKTYRNLTNVYYFIAHMCEANEAGEMPINRYFEKLPDSHPAKGIFAVAKISPERTRGSFFGSALATLRLFTNWNISDMTSKSDFDVKEIAKKKTAVFIIIPDEKNTFYSLVSLFLNQVYVNLVELANHCGGRVPIDVDFFMDEFGNFPAIPSFGSMLSVGAGRGLRFSLVLQDFQQLEKSYKEDYENIKGNCQVWVYLKSPSLKTLEELSKKTGTYTVQVNSVNNSISGRSIKQVSYSDSANMQSRALLLPDEIGRIDRPYLLILFTGQFPGIFYAPDLSQYFANEELGLGDKNHNLKIRLEREEKRQIRQKQELKLWEVWKKYKEKQVESNTNFSGEKRVSFLDL